jgi:hypothetical protein
LRKSVLLLLLCPFRVVNFVFLSLNPEKEHGLIPPGDLQVKVLRILFVLSSVLFLLNLLLLGCAALPPKRSKQVLWDGLTLRS